MYEFVDLNELPGTESVPAEAVKYNGTWLDTMVPGFQTLNVSGRELLTKEVREKSIPGIDGNTYLGGGHPFPDYYCALCANSTHSFDVPGAVQQTDVHPQCRTRSGDIQ